MNARPADYESAALPLCYTSKIKKNPLKYYNIPQKLFQYKFLSKSVGEESFIPCKILHYAQNDNVGVWFVVVLFSPSFSASAEIFEEFC